MLIPVCKYHCQVHPAPGKNTELIKKEVANLTVNFCPSNGRKRLMVRSENKALMSYLKFVSEVNPDRYLIRTIIL